MIGLGVLVALGRRLLAATLADTGLLPAGYYRHLVLAALEEEDFAAALKWLPYTEDKLLTQLVVLRLRLLAARHEEQRLALEELLEKEPPPHLAHRVRDLLAQQEKALDLLTGYQQEGLKILATFGNSGPTSPRTAPAAERDESVEPPRTSRRSR